MLVCIMASSSLWFLLPILSGHCKYMWSTGAAKVPKRMYAPFQVPAISDRSCKCVGVVCWSNLSRLEKSIICSDHMEGKCYKNWRAWRRKVADKLQLKTRSSGCGWPLPPLDNAGNVSVRTSTPTGKVMADPPTSVLDRASQA